jgi:hypothetical protein
MKLTRGDLKILEEKYNELLLNELTRQDKELNKKYNTDANQQFKDFTKFNKDYYRNDKDLVSAYKKMKGPREYQSKLNKILLVRVVPSFAGITSNENGEVIFYRDDTRKRSEGEGNELAPLRKTIHFVVNGVVGDHAFNSWDNAGIVIIADPSQIKAKPQTTRLEDTWYMVDRNNELNVGRATILAPTGLDIPDDMRNASIKTYNGTPKDAVKSILDKEGIEMLRIGAHGAESESENFDSSNKGENLFKRLQASNWNDDSNMSHVVSFESYIEGIMFTISLIYKLLKTHNLNPHDFIKNNLTQDQENELSKIDVHSPQGIINSIVRAKKLVLHKLTNNKQKDQNSRFQYSKQLKYINDFLKVMGVK